MHRPRASVAALAALAALAVLAGACASGPAEWTFHPGPETTPGQASPTPGAEGCSPDARVVEIEMTANLRMVPDTVEVTPGEAVCFQVTNSAGFLHDFHVGPSGDIDARNATDAVAGTIQFSSGTRELEYRFGGVGPFSYACWVPGHLEAGMKGAIGLR
jgi:plastocyanin